MSRIDEALRQAGISSAVSAAGESVQTDTADVLPTETIAPLTTPTNSVSVEPLPPSLRVSRPTAGIKFEPDEKLAVHPAASRTCIERYRRIAATLHHLQQERGVKVLMVASAAMGEGKTLTSANLALTLSESYRRKVLLIDADLRRPSLTALFRLQRSRGLSERLRGDSDGPLSVLEMSDLLALLPGGKPDSDPMAGLTSGRMRQIISQASAAYDWVILDTPPIGLQPDAGLLAAMVEAALLVVGVGVAPAAAVEAAIETIGRDKVVGVVLNRVEEDPAGEAAYYEYAVRDKTLPASAQPLGKLKP
jgi:capsular exopolysaccharide synthesis family protein